ncbi:MAG: glutamate--tRNA ligase [Clostridia bacterium]|nr:glutamate--tRNA ligase [Clostridia bacterium]MDD4686198.1 glutamate--tRNA ligase [Clostridia bacterium]
MNYKDIAELLFPSVNGTIADLEKEFPIRNLKKEACVTRFAPSPTGFLHIGSLYVSLISSTLAKQSDGVFYLRIEDTDKKREVEGGVSQIINTLKDYKIIFDEGAIDENKELGEYGPYHQSKRKRIYQTCAKELVSHGLAYPCFCTTEELDQNRILQEQHKEAIGYYGKFAKCRDLTLETIKEKLNRGETFVIRYNSFLDKTPTAICNDLVKGKIEFPTNQSDTIILKSGGLPTYHFAHIVDDHFMRTTHVIRGDEWLSSYPVHEQLFRAIGFALPNYIHIAPIMKNDGNSKRKLSKRKDSEAIVSYYNELGYPIESVLDYLMNIANSSFEDWRKNNPLANLIDFKFKISNLPKAGALFDLIKLNSVSKNIISNFTEEECLNRIKTWSEKYEPEFYDYIQNNEEVFKKSIPLWKGNQKRPRKDIAKWQDLTLNLSYLYKPSNAIEDYELDEFLSEQKANIFIDKYKKIIDFSFDQTQWFNQIKELASQLNYCCDIKEYKKNPSEYEGSIADMCALLRIILTGKKDGPDLYSLLQLMGLDLFNKRVACFKNNFA